MKFDEAIRVHAAWKLRFTLLNDGTASEAAPDPAVLARDNACDLGLWLHSEAKAKYSSDADYEALVQSHAKFHKAAAEVLRRILSGVKLTPEDLERSEYAKLSLEIIRRLMSMKRKYER